jgi:hypothetical protein
MEETGPDCKITKELYRMAKYRPLLWPFQVLEYDAETSPSAELSSEYPPSYHQFTHTQGE